eukprot:CAMPEP_0170542556 /NCGR_PEP_ID=MMETSP0211-20121228/1945_1 /TAXON_ID=311385 /ORGANISM="Pseudokeronopsis sp., Strain OXSARD2" /LENGTH=58 /DNA_ID=CAMNT_0010845657 /DNA_START=1429 /DNA_END=1605 /DNA_ORIENTATION=+
MDRDGDGYIDEEELKMVMGMGDKPDGEVMKRLISDIDFNFDNKIDFNEFKTMVQKMKN